MTDTNTPKGYTLAQENVPNPRPITGWENYETRWTENGENLVWKNGNIYTKPAPETTTTEWIKNLDKIQGK